MKARPRSMSGVRGRVVLTVLLVTACLYSLLGSIGFLHIATSGRDAIRERIGHVIDQLEATMRAGSGTVSLNTPDGVEAVAVSSGDDPFPETDDIVVRRSISLEVALADGSTRNVEVDIVGHASQDRLTESLRSLHRGLWIGVPIAVLLTATIAGSATRRALRPVSVITDLAASIEADESGRRVPVPDTDDEIAHLARTVNEMLDRIAAGRQAQRQFTSDAAHELRTPLMALQGEIELARRTPATTADEQFLERIDALGSRLARRVDDLVLLSTLDEEPPLQLDTVDVLDVVTAEAAAMPVGPGSPEITVAGTALAARVDERLLARAVRNLIANACRHARSNVRVEVTAADGRVWVHVDDDGPGVPAEHREAVLRRFGRLDEARDADIGGAGLGLAIVASVARAHGGDVHIATAPLGGARVSLALPVT